MATERTKRAERGAGTSKAEAKAAKELLFADLYVANGFIASKAFLAAGYKAKNANSAAVMAGRMLRKGHIARLIKERTQKRLEAAKLEADEVILSAARVIRFDPRRLVNGRGAVKGLHQLDEETALALDSVELSGTGLKVRVNRGAAREQLMKHLGLFERDNEQQPNVEVHPEGALNITFTPFPKTRKG